jgi:hypothetical protein
VLRHRACEDGVMTDHCSAELMSLHACDVEWRDAELGVDFLLSLHEMFTARACDELAVALAEHIEGGEVIQIRTVGEWPGGLLLHAGVHRDHCVYDVEGMHEMNEWIDRWGRGMEIEVRFLDPVTEQQPFRNMRSQQLAVDTALRLLDVPEFGSARQSLLKP